MFSQDVVLSLLAGLVGAAITARVFKYVLPQPTSSQSLPPGPKPLPIIGNLFSIPKSLPWLALRDMSKQYGPVMYFNVLGQPLVVLSSYQAAHDLLNRRGSRYSDRPHLVMAFELASKGMNMLLRPYDDRFKLHQRMEAPLLNNHSASAYRALQDIESRQFLFDVLSDSDSHGEKGVDFHHHHERAMGSTTYSMIYGFRLKTGNEQVLRDSKKVQTEFARIAQVGTYIVDTIPWLNRLPYMLAPWKWEADSLFRSELNLHMRNLGKGLEHKGWNFSHHMKQSEEAKLMPTEELAFDLGNISDAALDTSSITLDWFVVAWILTGSEWATKAQHLLDEVVGRDRLPNFDDREKLPFIDAIGKLVFYPHHEKKTALVLTVHAVVNETLRWRPAAPGGIPHFTRQEDEYEGFRIPANSIVLPNTFPISRDETIFGDNTEDFIPERWMEEDVSVDAKIEVDACGVNLTALKKLPYPGFGFGRRVCTGKFIARNSLFIQMARMLWAFDIDVGVINEKTGERHPLSDMDCTEGFLTQPKPFRAVYRPRGEWVRRIIERDCPTHDVDHAAILDRAAASVGLRT